MRCPSPSTSVLASATACSTCNEGFYFSPFPVGQVRCDDPVALAAQCREDDTLCFNQCCLKCEKGMMCETPANNTLEALAIDDGWWRDTVYSHDVYPCEYADSCKAGLCTTGHKGVACRVCEAGYHYSSVDGRCMECPGSGKRPNLALGHFRPLVAAAPQESRRTRGGAGPRRRLRRWSKPIVSAAVLRQDGLGWF